MGGMRSQPASLYGLVVLAAVAAVLVWNVLTGNNGLAIRVGLGASVVMAVVCVADTRAFYRLRRQHRPTDERLDYCRCGESWPCPRGVDYPW